MFYPKSPFLKCSGIESQIIKRNTPDIYKIFEWLCQTPKLTTYRINLLKTTPEIAQILITNVFQKKYNYLPNIIFIKELPEVLCISPLKEFVTYHPNLKEIIVDIHCGSALLRGAHVYAPGVLAMNAGTQVGESVNVFADLAGKCKKGTSCVYESNEKVFIGIGIVQMQRYQLFGQDINSRGIAIEMQRVISQVPSLGDLSCDKMLLQNLPSIVCCKVLNPQPKEIILDMCAAPGNKTSHILELTQNNSIVIAIDKVKSKVELLKQRVINNEWNNVSAFVFDSTKCLDLNKTDVSLDSILSGPPFPPQCFDRILLDAPCSSLGNRPLLKTNITSKILKSYTPLQKHIFENAVKLLKSKGTLVYSTCTIHEAENEDIIIWAKNKFPELQLVPAEPIFGGPGNDVNGLTKEERKCLQRFSLNNKIDIDTIGFFIAKFIKR